MSVIPMLKLRSLGRGVYVGVADDGREYILKHVTATEERVLKYIAQIGCGDHISCLIEASSPEGDTTPLVVMEKAGGYDIEHYLSTGDLTQEQLGNIAQQLWQTVSYLHSINVAHRDIHSENVFYAPDKGIKLIDFGDATYPATDDDKDEDNTMATTLLLRLARKCGYPIIPGRSTYTLESLANAMAEGIPLRLAAPSPVRKGGRPSSGAPRRLSSGMGRRLAFD